MGRRRDVYERKQWSRFLRKYVYGPYGFGPGRWCNCCLRRARRSGWRKLLERD